MLLVAGSITNRVLSDILMDTCCELTSHCWPQDLGKKRKKESVKSSRAEGKRSKPQRKDPAEVRPRITNHSHLLNPYKILLPHLEYLIIMC